METYALYEENVKKLIAKTSAYTGTHVQEQLQNAYQRGYKDALKIVCEMINKQGIGSESAEAFGLAKAFNLLDRYREIVGD